MFNLIFGLPGTGKTTHVGKYKNNLSIDFGPPRDVRQGQQIKALTSDIINNFVAVKSGDIYVDSFPEYFDLAKLDKKKIRSVVFLIPNREDADFILDRIEKREGHSTFHELYRKHFDK